MENILDHMVRKESGFGIKSYKYAGDDVLSWKLHIPNMAHIAPF
jgi:hypothetical protein